MRPIVKHILQSWCHAIEISGPVWEFGSFQVDGPEDDLRPIFAGLEYVGCDMRPGPGVDKIRNLLKLKIPANSIGTAVCVDTFEHVENPFRAIQEIHRVLRPGGLLFLISVMNFPIHYEPDYWRFTPGGFEKLLVGPFTSGKVFSMGGTVTHPETIAGIAGKGILLNHIADWEKKFESHFLASA